MASAATPVQDETVQVAGSALALELGTDGKAPEWVRLIPKGTFTTNDGRGPYHNVDPTRVIATSIADLGGVDAVGDYNHATETKDKTGAEAPAAGWVKEWRVVDGAIEGRVEWTKRGAQRISEKEFRYVSPVFDALKSNGNVHRIKRFALTNTPAIDELPAIAASRTTSNDSQENTVKIFAQALGLPEAATEAEICSAISAMRTSYTAVIAASGAKPSDTVETIVASLRAQPDTAKFVAIGEYKRVADELVTVTASRDELTKKTLSADVDKVFAGGIAHGQVAVASKDYWTEACSKAGSTAPLDNFLKVAPKDVFPKSGAETHAHKAPGANDTVTVTASQLNAAELAHCAKVGIKPESYAASCTRLGLRPLAA